MPTRKTLFIIPVPYMCLRKLWTSEMVVGTHKWRIQHVRLAYYFSEVTMFTCCDVRALFTQRTFYLPTLKSGKHLLEAISILFLPNNLHLFLYTTDILGGKW